MSGVVVVVVIAGAERAGQAVSSAVAARVGEAAAALFDGELPGGSHLGMLDISLSVLSRFPAVEAGAVGGVGCPAAVGFASDQAFLVSWSTGQAEGSGGVA